MSKQIIIGEQHRIAAVFSEDQIQELIVASGHHQVGDVYLGVVENVLPSIDAAFINIGNPERNGFIHVSDLGPIRLKRSSASITELVTPQEKVLVQVMKEPTGNKGPRLTGNVSLPGRYLVLMPYGRGVNLSSRIRDEEERNRLRSLAILLKPAQMGLMVRTEADGMPEESIIEDLEILKKQWESIQQESQSNRAPNLLNRDDDFIQRVLRDSFSNSVNRIVTDSSAGVQRVRSHLQNWNKGQMPLGVVVQAHQEPTSIFEFYRVNAAIQQALRPRVDLPSGGYIIIEPTEALTVIDVNSGSFTRSATSRETVLWTNCEAATEIARQMRLRNIAGVIVVDFIDMDSRRDQLQVLEHFNKALRSDKARPQIAQLSELGLVELTRKRQGQSLYEIFGRPCPTCEGLGLLAHLPGTHPEVQQLPFDRSVTNATAVLTSAVPDADTAAGSRTGLDRNGGTRRRGRFGGSRRSGDIPESLYPGAGRPRRVGDRAEFPTKEPEAVLEEAESTTAAPDLRKRREPLRRKVVAVEMTPLQQAIYAEMGISPLVLLEEPVKVDRDTVVAVTLPGQPVDEAVLTSSDRLPKRIATAKPGVIDLRQATFHPPSETDLPEESAAEASDLELPDWDDDEIDSLEPVVEFGEQGSSRSDVFGGTDDSVASELGFEPLKPEIQSPAASRRRRSRSDGEDE
jgi:ribonuclease E